LSPCTTSLISSYEVHINYFTNNGGHSTDSSKVPGNITSIFMSEYFRGHPLSSTMYNITVIAVNEGGRGIADTPECKYKWYCVLSISDIELCCACMHANLISVSNVEY